RLLLCGVVVSEQSGRARLSLLLGFLRTLHVGRGLLLMRARARLLEHGLVTKALLDGRRGALLGLERRLLRLARLRRDAPLEPSAARASGARDLRAERRGGPVR